MKRIRAVLLRYVVWCDTNIRPLTLEQFVSILNMIVFRKKKLSMIGIKGVNRGIFYIKDIAGQRYRIVVDTLTLKECV